MPSSDAGSQTKPSDSSQVSSAKLALSTLSTADPYSSAGPLLSWHVSSSRGRASSGSSYSPLYRGAEAGWWMWPCCCSTTRAPEPLFLACARKSIRALILCSCQAPLLQAHVQVSRTEHSHQCPRQGVSQDITPARSGWSDTAKTHAIVLIE